MADLDELKRKWVAARADLKVKGDAYSESRKAFKVAEETLENAVLAQIGLKIGRSPILGQFRELAEID